MKSKKEKIIEEITITVNKRSMEDVLELAQTELGYLKMHRDESYQYHLDRYWEIWHCVIHNSQDTHAKACQLAGTDGMNRNMI